MTAVTMNCTLRQKKKMSLIKTWLHEQQRRKEMAKAYFLLYTDDIDTTFTVDMASMADDLEQSTGFKCEDHIYFEDEDQVHPYIAY